MDKFFDIVKIDLEENIVKYFNDVEVESIKTNKALNTLNFYLVSYNLIPYDNLKALREIMAKKLLNINLEDEKRKNIYFENPIRLNISYKLSEKYRSKQIYDEIRRSLFDELKEKKLIYAALFRNDNIKFINDDTMEITFVKSKELSGAQDELIDSIKDVFVNRYNQPFEIRVNLIDYTDDLKNKREDQYIQSINTEVTDDTQNDVSPIESTNLSYRKKRNGILAEGNILYGKKTKGRFKFVAISNILYDMDNIETIGVIYNIKHSNKTKRDSIIYSLFIYDGEGCIEVKFFGNVEDEALFNTRFKIGSEVRVCGNAKYDSFSGGMTIGPMGLSCVEVVSSREVIEFGHVGEEDYHNIFITSRTDDEPVKRVELHLHTKSSAQDGVGEVKSYIDTATKFGMSAMAITDHGCVNALADAYEYLGNKNRPRKNQKFKLIYGVEGYLVEDFENYYIDENNNFSTREHNLSGDFVIFEIATTGLNKKNDDIIKIEAIKVSDFAVTDSYVKFVHSDKPINVTIRDNTGVKESDIINAEGLKEALKGLIDFAKDSVLVTSKFNPNWIMTDILKENGLNCSIDVLELMTLARLLLPKLKRSDLISIAKELKIKIPDWKISLERFIKSNRFDVK